MTRILGIDPGSQATGFGLIEVENRTVRPLRFDVWKPGRGRELPDRLHDIHTRLTRFLVEHEVDILVVETAFFHRNPHSTLVLGQVRGVILLAARQAGIPVEEYAPRQIKRAVTGNGGAAKEQVAYMVKALLGLPELPAPDAADALAVAVCHWQAAGAGALA
jgi:crossover junction endodeoxyribonuclease RuvC